MRLPMKSLMLMVVLALAVGGAYADCGAKDTHQGTLKSVDAEKNTVVVVAEDGAEVQLTLTPDTQVMDSEGKTAKVSKLVGAQVEVVSEHAKIDSIKQIA